MMKSEMRRKDRQLSAADAEKILAKGTYGVLSTLCEDGFPYGLPLSYAYEAGKIYFHHSNEESLLQNNIGAGTKACFTVVGETELLPGQFATRYESAVAFGTIHETEDKIAGLMQLVKKLSPDFEEKGLAYAKGSADQVRVYEFQIEQLTGKARR